MYKHDIIEGEGGCWDGISRLDRGFIFELGSAGIGQWSEEKDCENIRLS